MNDNLFFFEIISILNAFIIQVHTLHYLTLLLWNRFLNRLLVHVFPQSATIQKRQENYVIKSVMCVCALCIP